MNTQIVVLGEFLDACCLLDSDGIYNLFSDGGVTQELRDDVIEKYADEDSDEPTRSALNKLGQMYNIESLTNY